MNIPCLWESSTNFNNNWLVATQTFFFFTPKIGEDEPILTNIFQMGWNHQPEKDFKKNRVRITQHYLRVLTFPLFSATVVRQKMECVYCDNVEAPQFEGSVHPGWGEKLSQLYKNYNVYMYIIYEIWITFQIRHYKRPYSPISMECDKDVGVATHLHVWMPHNL